MLNEEDKTRHVSQVKECLDRARIAVEAGETALKEAADELASAQRGGATQRQMAEAIGKSAAWVNRLLQWRQGGCVSTPFGPQSKASRQKASRVQSNKHEAEKDNGDADEGANSDDEQSGEESVKAGRSQKKNRKRGRPRYHWGPRNAGRASDPCIFEKKARDRLIKSLGMLGSDQLGERAAAALVVEKCRRDLGVTWDELIVLSIHRAAMAA